MIALPRDGVRAFRNVLRKCTAPRSREFAPPILIKADGDEIVLTSDTGEVTLHWTTPNRGSEGEMVVPASVLDVVEGSTDTVQFVPKSRSRALVRWSDRGGPREQAIDLLPQKRSPAALALPDTWTESSSTLLPALHETGRTAARQDGRYALHRIQILGAKGQVIGTDANEALILGGWSFPFAEPLLVPAVPVFGCKELADLPARLGRTDTHVVVQLDCWVVGLRIDATSNTPTWRPRSPRPVVPRRSNSPRRMPPSCST